MAGVVNDRRRDRPIRPKALFVTTVDTFFLSHRVPIAAALLEQGFEVVVAASDSGAGDRIAALGARFIPVRLDRGSMSPAREARALADLVQLYLRERPDVVHQSSIKPILYGSLAARAAGVAHVVNTVSGLGYALIETQSPSLDRRVLKVAAKLGYRAVLRSRRAQNIFQNRDQLRMFLDGGMTRERNSVLVIGAGVDTDRFAFTPLPPVDPETGPLVVFPARILADKGVGELVEATRELRRAGQRLRVALVGGEDPDNRAAVPRAELDAWTAEGVVEWWGFRADMPEVFAQSHLVVLPSYAEGMPLALAEAASIGRVCVTTDVPGCREAVIDGESGFLVPVRDARALARAIGSALSDRERLVRMGERARAHAEGALSVARVVRQTLEVMREMGVAWPEAARP